MNPLKMLSRGGAVSEPSDADFKNVTLLLHGDGTNGAQNNTFLDSSTNNFTITRNGNTTQGTFSPFSKVDGRWGNYFDGSGDYLNSSHPDMNATWTIEAWIYRTTGSANQSIVFMNNNGAVNQFSGIIVYINTSNYIVVSDGVNAQSAFSALTVPLNAWTHVAIVRSSGTTTGYINGAVAGSNTFTPILVNSARVGFYFSSNPMAFPGYISNVRVVNGTAVYTSAFTPPTAPLTAITNTSLLTCQSNRFRDNSSNNYTITRVGDVKVTPFSPFPTLTAYDAATNGGSGYFDGTGDMLETPSITIGTNQFCFECWLYPPVAQGITTGIFVADTNGGLQCSYYGNTGLGIASKGVGWSVFNNNGIIPIVGQWNHVAFVRSGTGTNQTSIFLNGVRIANGTSSANYSASLYEISTTNAGGPVYQGYIAGARLTNGSTPYDATQSTITIPTAPANPTGSALCLNFTNAGILDHSMSNNLETVGNAQIDTTTKKYGTGSMKFDGTGDWLKIPSSPDLAFGTGDFTIEFYLNSNNVSSSSQLGILQTSTTAGGLSTDYTTGVILVQGIQSGGTALNGAFGVNVCGTWVGTSTSVVTINTWYHIAVVRSSGTVTIYVDGVSKGSGTASGNCTGQNLVVGGYYSTTFLLNGELDDLRITKGKARYTSNFTPPTAALPDIGE